MLVRMCTRQLPHDVARRILDQAYGCPYRVTLLVNRLLLMRLIRLTYSPFTPEARRRALQTFRLVRQNRTALDAVTCEYTRRLIYRIFQRIGQP